MQHAENYHWQKRPEPTRRAGSPIPGREVRGTVQTSGVGWRPRSPPNSALPDRAMRWTNTTLRHRCPPSRTYLPGSPARAKALQDVWHGMAQFSRLLEDIADHITRTSALNILVPSCHILDQARIRGIAAVGQRPGQHCNQRTGPLSKEGRNSASYMVRTSTLACHLESTPARSAGWTHSCHTTFRRGTLPFMSISRQARLAYFHFPWRSTRNSAAGDCSSKAARSRS
jgi:hypothetical protein